MVNFAIRAGFLNKFPSSKLGIRVGFLYKQSNIVTYKDPFVPKVYIF